MFARRGKRRCPRITGWRFRHLQAAGCGPLRAAGAQEGRNQGFSPLANHPFSFGREQALKHLPEDLRHLLPQIRARFARKVRNAKAPAAHFPKATRRADSTLQGCDRSLWGGSQYHACRNSNWVADGKRYLPLRAQRALKGMGLIGKKGKTAGVPLLVRSAAAQAANAQL